MYPTYGYIPNDIKETLFQSFTVSLLVLKLFNYIFLQVSLISFSRSKISLGYQNIRTRSLGILQTNGNFVLETHERVEASLGEG